jgi:hypothetical protein
VQDRQCVAPSVALLGHLLLRSCRPDASIQVKTAENEMEQSVEKIIERNLLEVFNGRDADSRRAAIDELWDKDGIFIDLGGVHDGVEKINAIAELLFTQFEGYVFSVRGPGQSIHGVGRLLGRMDRPKDGNLTALYAFMDPPSKK